MFQLDLMRILVLHNSGFYRTTLKTLLEAWGHDVMVAVDGHEAQRILEGEEPPRLAILDAMMPGLNGFEICERSGGVVHRCRVANAGTRSGRSVH